MQSNRNGKSNTKINPNPNPNTKAEGTTRYCRWFRSGRFRR